MQYNGIPRKTIFDFFQDIKANDGGCSPGLSLNLWAPWEVPIEIARLSAPVFSTNSSTSSGLGIMTHFRGNLIFNSRKNTQLSFNGDAFGVGVLHNF